MPDIASCNVRGSGVAVSVSMWTSARSAFSRSLCVTPKRCSSSTTTSPSRLKSIFFASSACVPMTTSIVPFASPSLVAFASLAVTSRDRRPMFIGKPSKRATKLL